MNIEPFIHIHNIKNINEIGLIFANGIHYAVRDCEDIPKLKEKIIEKLNETLIVNPNYPIVVPTGFKNGVLNLNIKSKFTQSELDALCLLGINPIRYIPGFGLMIWGQDFIYNGKINKIIDYNNRQISINKINPIFTAMIQGKPIINAETIQADLKFIANHYKLGTLRQSFEEYLKHKVYDFYVSEPKIVTIHEIFHDKPMIIYQETTINVSVKITENEDWTYTKSIKIVKEI